jgi:hypothetical protein
VEGGRIVVLVPAREGAGLGPHGITTPAGIDAVLAQVIPAITHTPFTEITFSNVGHVTGVPGPVSAPVDQQDIKWFAIMGELGPVRFLNKFMGRAVAYGAALWRLFTCENKTTDSASPGFFRVCVTLCFLSRCCSRHFRSPDSSVIQNAIYFYNSDFLDKEDLEKYGIR